MTYRAVVIDDQRTARQGIALALQAVEDVEIVAEFAAGEEALEELPTLRPDLVFVDIRMKGIDGLELVRRASLDEATAFIMVTAYDEHAAAAFDLEATDYVLKPFTDERLITAVRRGIEHVRSRRDRAAIETLRETLGAFRGRETSPPRSPAEPRYVSVKDEDRIQLVPVSEIAWIQADRNQVILHTGSEEHVVRTGLASMLEWLGQGRFIRVHRSHAVNIDAVREMQPWFNGDYVALMRGGERLRISRRYKDAILRRVL